MMLLGIVAVSVVVVVLEEEVLVGAVRGKGDGGDAEAGHGALESVPAGEVACVAPCFSVEGELMGG